MRLLATVAVTIGTVASLGCCQFTVLKQAGADGIIDSPDIAELIGKKEDEISVKGVADADMVVVDGNFVKNAGK